MQLGLALAADEAHQLINLFALWGGLTSLLYAFRLLSVRDGRSGSHRSTAPRWR
jgi:hypothetical protein